MTALPKQELPTIEEMERESELWRHGFVAKWMLNTMEEKKNGTKG